MALVAWVLPVGVLLSRFATPRHVIDYAGTALIGAAATCLVLLTSLGGTTFPWGSFPIILFGVLAVVFVAGFVAAERRAPRPAPPPHPFAHPVFSSRTRFGLAVAVARFGALRSSEQSSPTCSSATSPAPCTGRRCPAGSARPPAPARPCSTTCPRRSVPATSAATPRHCTRCSCSRRRLARWPSA